MNVALDTNILLDYFLNRPRSENIDQLFDDVEEGKPQLSLPFPVVLEFEWVLRRFYRLSRAKIVELLRAVLDLGVIVGTQHEFFVRGLAVYRDNPAVSFDDCIILEVLKHWPADSFLTRDRKLGRLYNKLVD